MREDGQKREGDTQRENESQPERLERECESREAHPGGSLKENLKTEGTAARKTRKKGFLEAACETKAAEIQSELAAITTTTVNKAQTAETRENRLFG